MEELLLLLDALSRELLPATRQPRNCLSQPEVWILWGYHEKNFECSSLWALPGRITSLSLIEYVHMNICHNFWNLFLLFLLFSISSFSYLSSLLPSNNMDGLHWCQQYHWLFLCVFRFLSLSIYLPLRNFIFLYFLFFFQFFVIAFEFPFLIWLFLSSLLIYATFLRKSSLWCLSRR